VTGKQAGIGFWPMAQQYRHIIPANPKKLACNHNLFDVHSLELSEASEAAFIPVLNCTLLALFKPSYGRYAGTEGNLKTEVVDALLMEVPDPRSVSGPVLKRLEEAFQSMQKREVTHLVEEALLKCHTAAAVRKAAMLPLSLPEELRQADRHKLDDAVFELLGVESPARRQALLDRLYLEVTSFYRNIRIVEVQKMEQRRQGGTRSSVSTLDLALVAWRELEPEWQKSISQWLAEEVAHGKVFEGIDLVGIELVTQAACA
jgi:hypothetical protein